MMLRTPLKIVCVIAVAFSSVVVGATGAWASGKVTATGNIGCHITGGRVKFSPPLVTGGTSPEVETYKVTFSDCFTQADPGTITEAGPAPASITNGTMKGSVSFTTNNCPSSSSGLTGAWNGATVKWKGASHYTTSVIGTSSSGAFFTGGGSTPGNALFNTVGGTAPVTGSFAGPGYPAGHGFGMVFGMTATLAQVQAACTPKTKAVRGSGGLKSANVYAAPNSAYILGT
jgi:hypothetical protein